MNLNLVVFVDIASVWLLLRNLKAPSPADMNLP